MDQVLAGEAVSSLDAPGDVLWSLSDNLGTVRDLVEYHAGTDTTTVANHLEYDAYGNIISETNAAVDFLFAFTGREWDAETQLQNNLNRWYDAKIGRWLSEDPIGFGAGDANLYRYVGNATSLATDPSGLSEYASLDEEYNALGGPTYTDTAYRKLRAERVKLGQQMLALVNNGRCENLQEILQRVTILANTTGYRSPALAKQPKFFQRAVEDLETSAIIATSSLMVFGMQYAYSGLHGFAELFGYDEGDNGTGDCWLRMEMQRNNLFIRRLDAMSNRINKIRAARPDLPAPP